MLIPPNASAVLQATDDFERDNRVDEAALALLISTFPKHSDPSHVLLKVAAINSIYSTNILAVKTYASQIHRGNPILDEFIEAGDLRAFSEIEYLYLADGKRWCFSFASKYLSWHRPEIYPIYDSRVDRYITKLAKIEGLGYKPSSQWTYPIFVEIVQDIRNRYSLEDCSFKQLDAFFFREGQAG